MRTVNPPERLPINEWFAYIQKQITRNYEPYNHSKEGVLDYQRTVRESVQRASRAEAIDFIELERD